jgi:hypothetical protein
LQPLGLLLLLLGALLLPLGMLLLLLLPHGLPLLLLLGVLLPLLLLLLLPLLPLGLLLLGLLLPYLPEGPPWLLPPILLLPLRLLLSGGPLLLLLPLRLLLPQRQQQRTLLPGRQGAVPGCGTRDRLRCWLPSKCRSRTLHCPADLRVGQLVPHCEM